MCLIRKDIKFNCEKAFKRKKEIKAIRNCVCEEEYNWIAVKARKARTSSHLIICLEYIKELLKW